MSCFGPTNKREAGILRLPPFLIKCDPLKSPFCGFLVCSLQFLFPSPAFSGRSLTTFVNIKIFASDALSNELLLDALSLPDAHASGHTSFLFLDRLFSALGFSDMRSSVQKANVGSRADRVNPFALNRCA
jgi:hypothetical protein